MSGPVCSACSSPSPAHRVDLGADGDLFYCEGCVPPHLTLATEPLANVSDAVIALSRIPEELVPIKAIIVKARKS